MSILFLQKRRTTFCRTANNAIPKSTFTTWRPIRILHDSTVQTFQRSAFIPKVPAKLPKAAFEGIPASAKWFQEPWPTFNSSYLGQFGDQMIQLEFTSSELASDSTSMFHRAEAPLNIFLQWAAQANSKTLQRLYVAQAPLHRLPKSLRDDLPTPELVLQAGKGDIYDASIWLGIAPTYTPLHCDPNPNLYLQLAGHKVIRIVPPDVGQLIFANVQSALGKPLLNRFRGDEMMKGREKDLLEAKIWHQEVVAHDGDGGALVGSETHLEAGESMFIPQGWWHSVKSIGQGCTASVNWWFR